MITAPKLYLKRKDISIQSLLDMKEADSKESAAGITRDGVEQIDRTYRSTTLKKDIFINNYPDVCNALLQMINIWDPTLDPSDFTVKEFNYLKYGAGDKFTAHQDDNDKTVNRRVFSTSTMINASDDLEGGDFVIYDDTQVPYRIDLDPGETIFFKSPTWHEVTEVKQGNREVLVAWIYYK
jgi:predicted 2-oxoglutarate/Fe(II)-dependent dioxygenase YbiX